MSTITFVSKRNLGNRLRSMSPIQTIVFTAAVVISGYFAVGYLMGHFWGSPRKPEVKLGYMPLEKADIDPCDCDQKLLKELMRGPMLSSDKRLIKHFKKNYLYPPSKEPYNLADEAEGGPDDGLSDIVLELLNQKRDGFFIESRVKLVDEAKSKFVSNTLHLEKEYGWEGIILEPDEHVYKILKSKHRKVYLVPGALSPTNYPQTVGFFPDAEKLDVNDIELVRQGKKQLRATIVQGFPISTIIRIFKVDTVDYLSLSVGGREFEVLGTIPWEKVKIKVLTIEHFRHQQIFDMIGSVMNQKGYIFISSVIEDKHETSIYAHPSLFES